MNTTVSPFRDISESLTTPRSGIGSLMFCVAAAILLEAVSVVSFRVTEGVVFAISTLVACIVVYSLSFASKSWK